MRLFLAIPLPAELISRLGEVQQELGSFNWRVRWSPPENLHITVHFLGETPENVLKDLHHDLSALAHERRPFDLSCSGLGAFPSWEDPRVIWAGIHDHGGRLKDIFEASYKFLNVYKLFKLRKEFTPHLTLGRVSELSHGWDARRVEGMQAQWQGLGRVPVEKLVLFKSDLRSEGAKHLVMETYKLNPAP